MSSIVRTVCAHDCPDMCSLLVHVDEGRVVRVQGDPEQPFTNGFVCSKVSQEPLLVHSPDRLAQPLRRIGPKGAGEFAPISWDEALDEIVARWQGIIRQDGPLALLGCCYSAHQGQINRGLSLALFHLLGATHLIAGTVCDTCADAAWEATLGPVAGADPETVVDSDLVISWGADLVSTNVHFWALLQRARARGATLVVIDPQRSRTAARADWHIPLRIGTDAALALGLMHVLVRDGLENRAYLSAMTVGFDRLEAEVLPHFRPARVAEITGVPADQVERLAHQYGSARAPFIRLGQGMSRSTQGGQAIRAVALLPGVTGAYARSGAGALLTTAGGFGLNLAALRSPGGSAPARSVNHARLGEALLTLNDPPIRALFVSANNPAVTCPDARAVRQGLAREDLFTVVHDPILSTTARYADIVLPAATYLESEDFYRSYGSYYMQFGPRAIQPVGEAWSNRQLAQELARRMGLQHPLFQMTTDELLKTMLDASDGPARVIDPNGFRDAGPIKISLNERGQTFATPSGKLEFYSEDLARAGADPMPGWRPELDQPAGSSTGSLRLLTAPGFVQSHTAFAGNRALQERDGEPICVINSSDAATRGLAHGDRIELFNARASVPFRLEVRDDVIDGAVLVPGQRALGGNPPQSVNDLCDTRYSDLGDGATYQNTWVDIRLSSGIAS